MKRRAVAVTVTCTPIPHEQAVDLAVAVMEAMDHRRGVPGSAGSSADLQPGAAGPSLPVAPALRGSKGATA